MIDIIIIDGVFIKRIYTYSATSPVYNNIKSNVILSVKYQVQRSNIYIYICYRCRYAPYIYITISPHMFVFMRVYIVIIILVCTYICIYASLLSCLPAQACCICVCLRLLCFINVNIRCVCLCEALIIFDELMRVYSRIEQRMLYIQYVATACAHSENYLLNNVNNQHIMQASLSNHIFSTITTHTHTLPRIQYYRFELVYHLISIIYYYIGICWYNVCTYMYNTIRKISFSYNLNLFLYRFAICYYCKFLFLNLYTQHTHNNNNIYDICCVC